MSLSVDTLIKLFLTSTVLGVGISYSKVYLFHLVFAAVLFLYFFGYLKSLGGKLPTRFDQMIPAMFFWFVLTLIWSWDRLASVMYAAYIFFGAGIIFVVTRYARDMLKQELVYRTIAFVIWVEIVLSLLECTGLFRLPISPYSSIGHYFGREARYDMTLEQAILAQLLSTPTGFEWNPNNLAAAMVIVLPFFLFMTRSWYQSLGVTSVLGLIVLSGSRGAVLATGLVLLAFVVLYVKKNAQFWLNGLVGVVGLTVAVHYVVDISFLVDAISALTALMFSDNSSSGYYDSIGIRQQLMANALVALKDTYGLGIGGGADVMMQKMFDNTYYGGNVNEQILSMHNFWIELLVNGGVLFFLVFSAWYGWLMSRLYRISKATKVPQLRYFASGSFLSMLGFMAAAISASSVIYFLPMWLLFGFSIATVNNYHRLAVRNRTPAIP